MEVTGKIKFKMTTKEANDLFLELFDITSCLDTQECKEHRALVMICELQCKLQGCLEGGELHNRWDKYEDPDLAGGTPP